jgi:N-acetylneuraminic acid mutarotase
MDKFLWTQRSNFGPAARSRHAMAYDSNRARTAMFGGSAGDAVFSDTWEWDGSYWTQMDDIGPGSRIDHAMAFDDARNGTLLFGGMQASGFPGTSFSDTWQWDGGDWTQLSQSGPGARSGHAMAFDSNRKVAVLFGGVDSTGAALADTWEFDGQDWTQQAIAGPRPRAGAAMTFDAAGLRVVLFGGSGLFAGEVPFGDT